MLNEVMIRITEDDQSNTVSAHFDYFPREINTDEHPTHVLGGMIHSYIRKVLEVLNNEEEDTTSGV